MAHLQLSSFRTTAPLFLLAAFLWVLPASSGQAAKTGRLAGGQTYQIPDWFSETFLDLREDISEAKQSGKHILLFLHLENCPYCAKMLSTGFTQFKSEISEKFVPIALNLKGGRSLTLPDGTTLTEKAYALKLRVAFTPTIVFLDGSGKIVARLNGYQPPANLKRMLDYVSSKAYQKTSFISFVNAIKTNKNLYKLASDKLFQKITDLSTIKKPLAILFEDKSCSLCQAFHDGTLKSPKNRKELEKFTVVRLDTGSDSIITAPDGRKTTAKKWADQLKLAYRPGLVLFHSGKEYGRLTSTISNYHFRYLLRYTSEQHFNSHDGWLAYLEAEEARRVKAGEVINIME